MLVTGDEPYQHMLASDMYRKGKEKAGFTDRKILSVETGFDWSELGAARHDLSLFGERTLVDLRIPTGKPGATGSKAIVNFTRDLHPDVALLIQAPRLDRSTMRSAWVKAVDSAGIVVRVWPLNYAETENWVRQKLNAEGFSASRETVAFIVQHVEGNLLAAIQELEKIALVSETRELTLDAVSRVLTDSSHYSLKDLTDALESKEATRCVRILRGFEKEAVKPPLVLWAMTERVRAMIDSQKPVKHDAVSRIPDGIARLSHVHQQHIGMHAVRHGQGSEYLLRQCALVDRVIKGQAHGNPWRELIQLGLAIQVAG